MLCTGAFWLPVFLLECYMFFPGLYANVVVSKFRLSTYLSAELFYAGLLDTVRRRSAMDCAHECSRTARCWGFKFHKVNLTCHTRGIVKYLRNKPDFSRFKTHMKTESEGGEELTCREAPVIPNSKKHTEGYFPGNSTTYTCRSDSIPCRKRKDRSVCQATGEWSVVKFKCDKYTWKSATTNVNYLMPCGGHRFVTITFYATPTRRTRATVQIMKGDAILLCMDMRLDCPWNNRDVLVINSAIKGTWKKEKRRKLKLKPGKEIPIAIRLKNGMSKIRIGAFRTWYRCQIGDTEAGHVMFESDISVRLLTLKT